MLFPLPCWSERAEVPVPLIPRPFAIEVARVVVFPWQAEAVRVFTDGACSGNPGPGGWAWVADDGRQDSGGESPTTNQRMELTAVLRAVETVTGRLEIHSDSTYVVNCFRDRWYDGWLARDWKNSQRKPVANRDLWEPLVAKVLAREAEVSFQWVKGHAGIEMNELADQLAVEAMVRHRDRLPGLAHAAAVEAEAATDVEAVLEEGPVPPWPIERAIVVSGTRSLDHDQATELAGAIAGLDPDNDVVVTGLRLGAEMEAAELARKSGIPLAVVLPYPDPAASWPAYDRARFQAQVEGAAWVVTLGGDPAHPGPAIKARNRWLWDATVGAIIVNDDALVDEAELAGLGVIAL